jgi:AcrR family transcriptional regulator
VSRGERAARTRETILDAAAEVFDRNGYPGAGLAEILDTAGVTKGALYFHFASKEELARAILADQVLADIGTDVEGPALQHLIDLSFWVGRQLVRNVRARAAVRLAIEHASFAVPLADPYLDWIRIVRSLLIRARDNGELRPEVDPDQVAHLIVAAFTGVQLTSEVLTGRKDLTQRLTELWTTILPALVTPEQQSGLTWTGPA